MSQINEGIQYTTEKITFSYATMENKKDSYLSHAHLFYEILLIVRGDCEYVEEDKLYKLNNNHLIITKPYVHHFIDVKSNSPYERYDLSIPITSRLCPLIEELPGDALIANCDNTIITELFKKLNKYSKQCSENDFSLLAEAILTEVLINLKLNSESQMITPGTINPSVRAALEYINEHLFEIKSIDEVSEKLFFAKNYFFRVFKKEMHISPKRYITVKRLLAAKNMIVKGEKPTSVFLKVGFNNYVSFYKSYSEYFGYSPSAETTVI